MSAHSKFLIDMERLSVYCESNKIPKNITKLAKAQFPEPSQEMERLELATNLLHAKYREHQLKCIDSEVRHNIGECNSAEKECLKFMNDYIFGENTSQRWQAYDNMRVTFAEENLEHIVDCFLIKSFQFRESKHDVYIQRMMNRVHRVMCVETKWTLDKQQRVSRKGRRSRGCSVS